MRRYLAYFGVFIRKDTEYIKIPGRRFWSLSNTRANYEAKQLLKQFFAKIWQSL